jgi:hypothetical protein
MSPEHVTQPQIGSSMKWLAIQVETANMTIKMNKEHATLRRIESLREPRHLFTLPGWAEPSVLDRLIREGYLTCANQQRDEAGTLVLVMGLELTAKADRLLHPKPQWQGLALKGSIAGMSFAVMSVVILYLG